MRVYAPALVAASILALAAADAAAQQADQLSRQDRTFAEHAMAGGMMEVQLGQISQDHAATQAVRAFGGRMMQDHKANDEQLKTVASGLGLTLPTTLPADQQHQVDRLSALHGRQFDDAYMAQMIDDHQQDIKEYRKEAEAGANPQLKSYAEQTLPMLRQHLALAEGVVRPQGAALPPGDRP